MRAMIRSSVAMGVKEILTTENVAICPRFTGFESRRRLGLREVHSINIGFGYARRNAKSIYEVFNFAFR